MQNVFGKETFFTLGNMTSTKSKSDIADRTTGAHEFFGSEIKFVSLSTPSVTVHKN